MSSKVYVGVDGGGTKTKVVVCDSNEQILLEKVLDGLNINQIGNIGFEERIIEISELLKAFEVMQIVFGVPGYGESRKNNGVITEIINSYFGGVNQIYNDVKVAHFGALGLGSGVQVVAGTGSIGFLLDGNKQQRIGGYGPLIGDEGSAYAIGVTALNHMSHYFDKRISKDKLISNIMYIVGINTMDELIDYVYNVDNPRLQVASISEIVDMSSNQGCMSAQVILSDAAKELSDIALELCTRCNCSIVSYSGSVFKSKLVLDQFTKVLEPQNIKVVAPMHQPDRGALLKALEFKNKDCLLEEK